MELIKTIVGVLLVIGLAPGSGAEPVNPFAHPVFDAPAQAGVADLTASGRPELRGVIVAGAASIANLSGTLLALGEETAGFRLESVSESSATFLHQGEPVTLYLPGEQPEEVQ